MSVKNWNPATAEQLASSTATDLSGFPEIIKASRAAQRSWREFSFKKRAEYLQKLKQFLSANAERAAEIVSKTNGKTRTDAMATEVVPCILACDWYSQNAEKILRRQRIPTGSILFANKSSFIEYVPVGVVGIISPWNYPLTIPFGEVIMGLMAGNAIILKVATQTTLVGEFIEEAMRAAKLPPGVFTHIIGSGPQVSNAMLENGIDKIFFTGSVGVGKDLMRQAANTLTPLSLELGGKDPMIVLKDADLERAANCAAWAGYQNAGQSCGGVERVYVHSSVYNQFVELLASKTRALRHGVETNHQVDIGSMTTKSQLEVVRTQVKDALDKGAKIVAQSTPIGDVSKGYFYPATLLVGVNHSMLIMQEETFGPVVPVMPFDTLDEAIGLANDCNLALTSSIFGGSTKEAAYIASRLESGVTTVNDHLYTHGVSETPWGGWKLSGLGRTHSALGLKEMCNAKTTNYERLPSCLVPRNIWWYPFSSASYKACLGIVKFVAPQSVADWFRGVSYLLPYAVKTMFFPWRTPGAPTIRRFSSGSLLVFGALATLVVSLLWFFLRNKF